MNKSTVSTTNSENEKETKDPISFHDIIKKSFTLRLLSEERAIELCKQCEKKRKTLRKNLEKHPSAYIFGEINYDMTLEEMKQKIREKLNTMKKRGLLISKEEFKKIKNVYFDYPFTNITRIWGIEYLKKKINESEYLRKKYNVPGYVIVVDDISDIKIELDFYNSDFPSYFFKSPENAAVYFENINGTSSYQADLIEDLLPIGFVDFMGTGNIRQEKESGKYYIIDTERKSFKIPVKNHDLRKFILYSSAKFKHLNNLPLTYGITVDLKLQDKDQEERISFVNNEETANVTPIGIKLLLSDEIKVSKLFLL